MFDLSNDLSNFHFPHGTFHNFRTSQPSTLCRPETAMDEFWDFEIFALFDRVFDRLTLASLVPAHNPWTPASGRNLSASRRSPSCRVREPWHWLARIPATPGDWGRGLFVTAGCSAHRRSPTPTEPAKTHRWRRRRRSQDSERSTWSHPRRGWKRQETLTVIKICNFLALLCYVWQKKAGRSSHQLLGRNMIAVMLVKNRASNPRSQPGVLFP